jgi:NDP-sugar pyrophosphorylase family protein
VILAGGIGSWVSEGSHLKLKPMIEISGKPMVWHIMRICSAQGVSDFIISPAPELGVDVRGRTCLEGCSGCTSRIMPF